MVNDERSPEIRSGKEQYSDKPGPNLLLRARDLCKSFTDSGSRIEILNGVNADLEKGETLAVVGASGIGKSTLLHILGTLDRPDSGELLFQDEDVFGFDKEKLAKFRNESIGFIFQFHHLLAEFNAVENAMMPALINGYDKEAAGRAAEKILVRVGLKDRLFSRVGNLSGGEQQRVALARSLILKPAILLADEPTGNLDKQNSEQVHQLLLELNRELSMTMVVVTHNMELASYMRRRVTISDGQLVELH
jgi:lipoprotein-releasing system ATP-binding protein